jgi:MFS family permease
MNVKNSPEGTIRGALRYPAFRALLAGLAVSQAGDWLYNIALVTLVYQRTGSAMWAGVTTAARIVPMVVLGPFGGIVADRFDRRRVMVACDLVRLALMLMLALVAAANLPAVLAPVIAALATAAATPYLPSVAATTPRLVAGADLPGANAARAAVTGAGIIAGPALGGVLLLLGQPALAFAVNAATFGASAVCVLAIRADGAFRVERVAPERPAHPAAVRLVGADAILVQIMTETGLQRTLPHDVFGRAYGLAIPTSIGGIGAGSLIASALASTVGLTGGLLVCGSIAVAYGAALVLGTEYRYRSGRGKVSSQTVRKWMPAA